MNIPFNLLEGYSGCKIFLLNENVVRKISPSLEYNTRLKRQANKQKEFNDTAIQAPQILEEGYTSEGFYYFDMEYIKGIKFSEFVVNNSIDQVKVKFNNILEFVKGIKTESKINVKRDIENKIEPYQKRYKKLCDYCLDIDWTIEKSWCHGDLAFENILISGEELYFIDFLDSFVESTIADYSKILQDSILGWSWRNEKFTPHIKNISITNMMRDSVTSKELEIINRMLVINIFRIFPYIKSKKDKSFLHKCLEHLERRFIS
tara:strand:- start:1216 stop:2001 length:786 start_codon:yes stop_codon:yes gene_type:complete